MRARVLLPAISAFVIALPTPGFSQEAVSPQRPGGEVKAPALVHEVKPRYTEGAMRARVQGFVRLEAVVGVDGTVGDVRITTPLDPELDVQAIDALKQWTFKPGTRPDEPVPVLVEIEMTFTLKGRPDEAPVDLEVSEAGPGIVPPEVLTEVTPDYTNADLAGVQGTSVAMECVVRENGRVGQIKVTRSLGPALDAKAASALRKWRFKPGTKEGTPVPVRTTIEVSFPPR
jgi:TonB family protein